MRIAWENKEDRDQIPKILNDLEHIASKLDLDSRSGSAAGGGSRNDQLLDLSMYKTEAKKAKSDNDVLRRNVYKLEERTRNFGEQLKRKEAENTKLNSAVKKLTEINTKIFQDYKSLENHAKALEQDIGKIKREIFQERLKTSRLESDLKSSDASESLILKFLQKLKENTQDKKLIEE